MYVFFSVSYSKHWIVDGDIYHYGPVNTQGRMCTVKPLIFNCLKLDILAIANHRTPHLLVLVALNRYSRVALSDIAAIHVNPYGSAAPGFCPVITRF